MEHGRFSGGLARRMMAIACVSIFLLSALYVCSFNCRAATTASGYLPDDPAFQDYEPDVYLESRNADPYGNSEVMFNSDLCQVSIEDGGSSSDFWRATVNPLITVNTLGGLGYLTQHYDSWDPDYQPAQQVVPDLTGNKGQVITFGKHDIYSEPFTFRYYGFSYDSCYVSENGYILLGQTSNSSLSTPQTTFPYSGGVNGVIAIFWTDLVTSVGEVFCGFAHPDIWPDVYSISWWGVSAGGYDQMFILSLREDGAIVFTYVTINSRPSNTIAGYENIVGDKGGYLSSTNIHSSSTTIVYPNPASYKFVNYVSLSLDKLSSPTGPIESDAGIYFADPTDIGFPFPGWNIYTLDQLTTAFPTDLLLSLLALGLKLGVFLPPPVDEICYVLGWCLTIYNVARQFAPEWTPLDNTYVDSLKGTSTTAQATLYAEDWAAKAEGYSRPLPSVFCCMPTIYWDIVDPNRLEAHSLRLSLRVHVTDNSAYNPLDPDSGFIPSGYSYDAGTLRYDFAAGNDPEIAVTSPNGGESWYRGESRTITWSKDTGSGSYVNIDLYKGGSYHSTIASSTSNVGSYTWAIPADFVTGTDFKIRVGSTSVFSAFDFSNTYFSIVAPTPTITVTSPNGGESWLMGSAHSITWTYANNPGSYVKIELYRATTLVSTITSSTLCDGSYTWTVPTDSTYRSDYRVKISSTTTTASDYSNAYFSIVAGLAQLPYSDSFSSGIGDWVEVELGGVVSVDTAVGSAAPPSLKVSKSDTSAVVQAKRYFSPITTGKVRVEANIMVSSTQHAFFNVYNTDGLIITYLRLYDGDMAYYNKAINDYVEIGQTYDVNVWYRIAFVIDTDTDTYDIIVNGVTKKQGAAAQEPAVSVGLVMLQAGYYYTSGLSMWGDDVYIADADLPSITVTSPNGGESWTVGTTHDVTWTYANNPGTYVKIELYRGATLVSTLTSSTACDGSYPWTISTSLTPASDYRVKISSTTTATSDYSDAYFTIVGAPTITVTAPTSSSIWTMGYSAGITWTSANNPGSYVKIELYKGGTLVYPITSSTYNDGSHLWTVSTTLKTGDDYRVKVSSTTTSAYDYSDYFTIKKTTGGGGGGGGPPDGPKDKSEVPLIMFEPLSLPELQQSLALADETKEVAVIAPTEFG